MRAFSGDPQNEDAPRPNRRTSGAPAGRSGGLAIAAHPIFTPALTGWAAAILALVVIVLPSSLIARLAMLSGLEILGDFSRFVLAAIAGLAGAAIGYGLARVLKNEMMRTAADHDLDDAAGEHEAGADAPAIEDAEFEEAEFDEAGPGDDGQFRPIDPAAELGSESLDAPLETAPTYPHSDANPVEDADFEELSAPAGEKAAETETETAAPAAPAQPEEAVPKTGRRRDLAQLAREEAAASNPQFAQAGEGLQKKPAAPDPIAQPAIDPEAEVEPGPWMRREADDETAQASTNEPAENVSADEPEPESPPEQPEPAEPQDYASPAGLPNAQGAQSALDALIKTASAKPHEPLAATSPASMQLEEFGALPGRNAVWVEDEAETALDPADLSQESPQPQPKAEPQSEPESEPEPIIRASAESVPKALAQLRAQPIEDLSMVQMIERFAAALEDRKAARVGDPEVTTSAERKQALASTLKGLTGEADIPPDAPAVSQEPEASEAEASQQRVEHENAKLRDALDKLADLRGAA